MHFRRSLTVLAVSLLIAAFAAAANRPSSGRYALILADIPVAQHGAVTQVQSETHRQRILAAQTKVQTELARRGIAATGSVQLLLNAVFVQTTPDRADELRSLPGVTSVIPMRRFALNLNAAVNLVNAPAAWNALGGIPNAGAGVKIAILDTGIDQNHPAFKNATLATPSGYPICAGSDCNFTNKKVIVARSYVSYLAAGTQPNPAADSRPDDYSVRDRVGHGTAVASVAAGQTNTGPGATITGMAPQAWLGNYKIFGSPGVNDFASTDGIIAALEDAVKDGMNIAVLSLGASAFSGPLDTGAACGNAAADPCDPEAVAIENATKLGLLVVAAAGNEADTAVYDSPAANTIDSPGHAPSAIAAGATTNSHFFGTGIHIGALGSPFQPTVLVDPANSVLPPTPLSGVLVDTSTLGSAQFCTAPSGTPLAGGKIAVIARGTCTFSTKVLNAQAAGAIAAFVYDNVAEPLFTFSPSGFSLATIPAVFLDNATGLQLISYLTAHPLASALLDPTPLEIQTSTYNTIASFSSRGPSTGDSAIKPDVSAVGTNMFMAAQTYDPLGELYSATGYFVADGTSFSTPLTAGAAALVKQTHPNYTPGQIKSAIVNTASSDITGPSGVERVNSVGSGKVDAGAAVKSNVSIEPATVSFGNVTTAPLPISKTVTVTNLGSSGVSLQLAVSQRDQDSNASVTLDKTSLTLAAGQAATVTVKLSGSRPSAGSYEGAINIAGAAAPLHVPYEYIRGDGVVYDMILLSGEGNSGTAGQLIPDGIVSFKLIDRYGLPASGIPVTFTVRGGTGKIANADAQTDQYGIAAAELTLGPEPTQTLLASGGGAKYTFTNYARPVPAISAAGFVNAASFEAKPLAPGSFATLFGKSLSDYTDSAARLPLPLNIDLVNVSFDTAAISVPARVYYVSPTQVNVQIPWELQGQTSAKMKLRIGDSYSNVVTVPLATYSPALFSYTDTNQKLSPAALDQTNKLIGAANPASRGQTVQLYANGLGPVNNNPGTGSASPGNPLATCAVNPTVTVGGAAAPVTFCGLAPGYAGLYQLNVTIPAGISAGLQPIVVSIGGVSSLSTVQINLK